ncbi:MAG: response regulator [Blastocatellia bacterium]|nr:response regulator [Blastocatellia bacterium]
MLPTPPKVLVVDDDAGFRLIARRVLTRAGYLVEQAGDGGAALEVAEQVSPAVILLDWMMPVLDGPEVCRLLRENPKFDHSQIIMVSAKGELNDKISGLESGADDYLVKPCEPRELTARVRSAMRVYELKRQLAEKAEREALLRRAAAQIRSSLDIDAILSATVEEVRKVCDASRAVIFQLDEPTQQISVRTEAVSSGIPSVASIILAADAAPFSLKVLKKRQSGQIPDLSALPDLEALNQLPEPLRLKSIVAVPIIVGTNHEIEERLFGLALHQCGQVRHWTDEEIAFLESLATQTGIALEHARLYRVVQERNRQLQENVSKLEELARQREEFTAVLVHDIRSPLSVVIGSLEILSAKAESLDLLDEDLGELFTRSRETVDNIITLVNEILDFSKAEAGAMQLDLLLVHPLEIVDDAFEKVELLAHKKEISLGCLKDSWLPQILVDPVKISRALQNLLTNAIKFTSEQGKIRVEIGLVEGTQLEHGRQFLKISVIDNGPGIPAKYLPYLFNPYYQARQRSRQLGTGLGLAIVQRIVAAHGGNVQVQSSEGVGSAFSLVLPLANLEPLESSPNH